MHSLRKLFLAILIFYPFVITIVNAEIKKFNMVFVPASEKGDENDFKGLIEIVNKLTGFEINFIKVTDYNSAVEAMRAERAQIAWYGGKTYIKAAELANAEAFAAGVRPGEKDAGYYTYFVVRKDSKIKKFSDVRGKVLSLNSIGSTSGDLIPQVELAKINISTTNKNDLVIDPFLGTGTTSVACKELGRKSIGIEMNKDYSIIAKKRLQQTKKLEKKLEPDLR